MTADKVDLDGTVHAPIRLAALSILASVKCADFVYLKEAIGTTDGNLSVHLTRLESAGYIAVRKHFKGNRPATTCTITEKGRRALARYLERLEAIVHPGRPVK